MTEHLSDVELITQYAKTHDAELREAIILRYVPLVHFVIRRLGLTPHSRSAYEDLVSHGLLGLISAVDGFDAGRGTQFSTYATVRIRGQILDHLRAIDWLPRSARRRAKAVQEANTELWTQLHRAPTDEELAGHLDMDLELLRKSVVEAGRVFISLDASQEKQDEVSLHETLSDPTQVDPSEAYEEKELKKRLMDALTGLSKREQLLLSLYYFEGLTMKEVGEVLGVSESRICQLHARTLMNVKSLLNTDGGRKPARVNRVGVTASAKQAETYDGPTGMVYEA